MPIMLKSNRCMLQSLNESGMSKVGECPLDPGGYFLIRGVEKIILMQEKFKNNRIIVSSDSKGTPVASVTSVTTKYKSKTAIIFKHGCIYVKTSIFQWDIPIVIIFKGMGIETYQTIMQMVSDDSRMGDLLIASIQECKNIGI